MSLWDEVEESNTDIEIDNLDYSNKDYRKKLVSELVEYSLENRVVNELCENISKNLKDISKDEKEQILETFTKNSKLLDSSNNYLSNPIKGMRLISTLIAPKEIKKKSDLEKHFEAFEKYLDSDFLKFSSLVNLANEAKLYKKLMEIKEALLEDIKFVELVSKTHIGIGGSFSAGKSSFLNSILNRSIDADDILPIDTRPTTSIPTYIVKKENSTKSDIDIYTFNNSGEKSKIDKEALLAISHEFDKVYNFGLISILKKIVVDVDSMPYSNIAFLDTPGYSKSDGEKNIDKNIALTHLQNIDALIWLIDIDNGTIRDGDIKFIKSLNFKGDILFVVNKADKKPKSDIKNILTTIKTTLKSRNINFVNVVAYSSHEREEYFSKNVIDNFLKGNNRAKPSTYKFQLLKIINEYEKFIKEDKAEKRAILKVLNEVDLFSDDIKDIDTILEKVKKAINSYNKSEDELQKVKENFLEFGKLFDKELGGIEINNKLFTKDKIIKDEILKILPFIKSILPIEIIEFLEEGLKEDKEMDFFHKYYGQIEEHKEYFDFQYFFYNIALYYAVRKNNINRVKSLIELGADVNKRYKEGKTLLYYAVDNNSVEIVKLLIKAGIDIDVKGIPEKPLLRIVVEKNNVGIAKLLIDAGADINTKDGLDKTLLHIAVENNAKEVIQLLINKGIDINAENVFEGTALHIAIKNNSKDIVKLLIDAGADINLIGGLKGTPLLYAIENNSKDIIKLLIEAGADVNEGFRGTPLHYAVEKNLGDVVNLLIDAGADINLEDAEKGTPLHCAAKNNSKDIAKVLIDRGADVDAKFLDISEKLNRTLKLVNGSIIKDDYGETPLHIAIENSFLNIAKLLIEAGANVNIVNSSGDTPLHIAVKNNNIEIVKLLLEAGADEFKENGKNREKAHKIAKTSEMKDIFRKYGNPFLSWFI